MVKFMNFYRNHIHNKFGKLNFKKSKNKFEYFVKSKYKNEIISKSNETVIYNNFLSLLNSKRNNNSKQKYNKNYYIIKKRYYIRKPLRRQIINKNEIKIKKLVSFHKNKNNIKLKKKLSLNLQWDYENPCDK